MAVLKPRTQASTITRNDLDEDQLDRLEELRRNDQVRQVHEHEVAQRALVQQRKSAEAFEALIGQKATPEKALGGGGATRWVVDGLLEYDTISRWIGAPGHYKSFMAISLGMCIARGIPWMGFETSEDTVLYVANEGGTGIGKRIEAFRRRHGYEVLDPGSVGSDFRVWSEGVRIGGPNWERWCDTVTSVVWPGLIIFDTQSKCAPDFDENNPAQMAQMINHLEYLRRKSNACILLLHHPVKNGTGEIRKQGRGSNTVTAGIESEAFVERTKPLTCRLQVTRHKDEENWADIDRWETFELARVGWEVETEDFDEAATTQIVTSLAFDRRVGGQTEAGTPLDVVKAAMSEAEVPTSGEPGASAPVRMARLVAEAGPGGVEPSDLRAQFVELLTRVSGTAPADGADRKALARLKDRGHLLDHPDIKGRLILSHEGHEAAGLPCMRATCK
jgi:hypothetical protein